MSGFLSKIIKFNNLLVIGVFRNTDDTLVYNTLRVNKKGSNLVILSSSVYTTFEDLLKNHDTKLPVVLHVDGKGVLNKQIDLNNEADLEWKKNLDFNSMYFIEYKTSTANFLSFTRKKNIDDNLKLLQENKFQVVDFYLGSLLSALLSKALETNEIVSGETLLSFDNNILSAISKYIGTSLTKYKIAYKTLSQHHIALYGSAINFFIKPEEIESNTSENISIEESLYRKAFNYFGIAVIALFLVSLLSSYLLIQYYLEKNVTINQQNLYSNQTYEYILDMEKQKKQKLEVLNKTGQLSKNFLSFYIYQLIKSTPSGISLSNLDVFPVSKEIKAEKKINITPDTIIIKGFTTSGDSFDNWLDELSKMKWIKKFEVISIKKDKKNIQQFELKILIANV